MEIKTEKPDENALSEVPPLFQENTTTLEDKVKARELLAMSIAREHGAKSLGGYRAADDYRAERFFPSVATAGAFAATQSFDSVKDNLYLCGPTGSGKSHLAAVAARRSFIRIGPEWMDRVRTYTPMQISRLMRSCSDAQIEQKEINNFIGIETLVLEDLGAQKDTEFIVSILYEIINGRYQNSLGGLIVTSNLTLGDLAQKMGDDRIPSRLSQMCAIFNLAEPDHRPLKN